MIAGEGLTRKAGYRNYVETNQVSAASVSSSGTANSFGSWVEYISPGTFTTGLILKSIAIALESASAADVVFELEIEVGTNILGSNTIIGRVVGGILRSNTFGEDATPIVTIPLGIFVDAARLGRLGVRIRDNQSLALAYRVTIEFIEA